MSIPSVYIGPAWVLLLKAIILHLKGISVIGSWLLEPIFFKCKIIAFSSRTQADMPFKCWTCTENTKVE